MIQTDLLRNPQTPLLHLNIPHLATLPSHGSLLRHRALLKVKPPPGNLGRLRLLHFLRNPNFQVRGGSTDGLLWTGESDLPVELCVTYTLPPALTHGKGVERLKEAVEKLKLNPPCSTSGVVRFQVTVPPSIKALNWLCSQHNSSEAFPKFYLSRKQVDESLEVASLDGILGISGVGAALFFHGSACDSTKENSLLRYLSGDSPLIRAYGFIGISYDKEPSSVKNETGPFYIFIPQVELDELESMSILASTLAWDNSLSCTFREAICSVQLYLDQIIYDVPSASEFCRDKGNSCIQGQFCSMEVKSVQMPETPTFTESYLRLSTTVAFTNKMFSSPRESYFSVNELANMNNVWAAFIVEECVRLGLTYFCIAPGSRSSPLAISASTHPLATCISCFDERSLAFHAVGYARGSQRPAVVITSSGTAVSNLLPALTDLQSCRMWAQTKQSIRMTCGWRVVL